MMTSAIVILIGEQQVEQQRRDRNDHQHDEHHRGARDQDRREAREVAGLVVCGRGGRCLRSH